MHSISSCRDLLLNTASSAVSDSLLGLATLDPQLEILNTGNVVMLKELDKADKVLILSGGASGTEPAYAHFVGKGMLAAAVQGDLMQSPASRPILQTIRELSAISFRGILLIVSGNSGDLFNFGLATERAKKDLLQARMLPVFDSYRNNCSPPCKQRGLSGIVLVLKIAGAMAEEGQSIDKIYEFCELVTENLTSISLSTKEYILRNNSCLCKSNILYKFGTSINGETPVRGIKKSYVMDLVKAFVEELLNNNKEFFMELRTTPVVLLINNVGGVSKLEEMIVLKELVHNLDEKGITVCRIYSGTYLGSMYFDGIIASLLKVVNSDILKYLDYPTSALGWRNIPDVRTDIKVVDRKPSILRKKPRGEITFTKGPTLSEQYTVKLRNAANFACEAIVSCEKQLNKIDSELGNGNTGTRLKTAAVMFLHHFRANKAQFHMPYHFFQYLSKLCEYNLGGPMGCIFCILFEAASTTFLPLDNLDDNLVGPIWLETLKNAVKSLKTYSMARAGDNTILDPLEACINGIVQNILGVPSYLDAFGLGVEYAEIISSQLKYNNQFPDPGGHAIVIVLRAVYEALKQS